MDKVSQAYRTSYVGLLNETHIFRHIGPARKTDFTRSEIHLVRMSKRRSGTNYSSAMSRNHSASF
jgi:hypothetical protein